MDVSNFQPQNLRIVSVNNSGYLVAWSVGAAGLNAITSGEYSPIFVVYGRAADSGVVSDIATVASSTGNFAYFVPSGFSELYVTAKLGINESAPSNSVTTVSTNIMPQQAAIAVGRDEQGNARSLATTEDGVLKVTGVTVNNYGGDASAANQATTISKLDGLISATNAVKTSTDAVSANLSGISLAPSTINALQQVVVTNHPSDYPDSATTAAISTMGSTVAKEVTLENVRQNTLNLVKSTDLSLNMGVLDVSVTNQPSDYPDTTTASAVLAGNAGIANIDSTTADIYTRLDVTNTILGTITGAASATATNTANTETALTTVNASLATLIASNTAISANTLASDTKLGTLNTAAATLLKTSDLDLTAGVLSVNEVNKPMDYPDAAALAALNTINSSVQSLASSQNVVMNDPLPAGTNVIGHVIVDDLPLAQDAATEGTLVNVLSKVNTGNSLLNALRTNSSVVAQKIDELKECCSMPSQSELFTVWVDGSGGQNTAVDVTTILDSVNEHSRYVLHVFSYAAPGTVSLFRRSMTSSGAGYEHGLPNYKNVSIFANTVIDIELPSLYGLVIKFTGTGNYRVTVTGVK